MDWGWKQARGHDDQDGGISSFGGCPVNDDVP